MKKKLEAELISIAHRVLKIHNREDITQLQQEALNLYQKLSILRFYEEHFEPAKPTIGKFEIEAAIEDFNISTENVTIALDDEKPSLLVTDTILEKENEEEQLIENEPLTTSVTTDLPVTHDAIENTIDHDNEHQLEVTIKEEKVVNTFVETPEVQEEEEPVIEEVLNETLITFETEDLEQEEEIVESYIEEFSPETVVINETITPEQPLVEEELINTPIEAQKEKANPLFNEQQPTLIESFGHDKQEPTLFTDNLFSETNEALAPKVNNSIQTSFENLFGQSYKDLEFVKADEAADDSTEKVKVKRENKKAKQEDTNEMGLFGTKVADLYTSTITLGLNDRIAFQVHLFNNSDQDLNRVVSQLNTMNNLDEALDFINNMVKPDYNNWQHKEEYEDRFMALVEKRFS